MDRNRAVSSLGPAGEVRNPRGGAATLSSDPASRRHRDADGLEAIRVTFRSPSGGSDGARHGAHLPVGVTDRRTGAGAFPCGRRMSPQGRRSRRSGDGFLSSDTTQAAGPSPRSVASEISLLTCSRPTTPPRPLFGGRPASCSALRFLESADAGSSDSNSSRTPSKSDPICTNRATSASRSEPCIRRARRRRRTAASWASQYSWTPNAAAPAHSRARRAAMSSTWRFHCSRRTNSSRC